MKRALNLLAIVHKYPPHHNAGAEWMLHAIARHLTRAGHRLTVAFPVTTPYTFDGIDVLKIGRDPAELAELAGHYDGIITHLDQTGAAIAAGAAARRPVIHLVHNDSQLDYHRVRRADLVVFNSEWMAEAHRRWNGPTVIVRPPCPVEDYETPRGPEADAITLINLNAAKGANTFWKLAGAERARRFLGVIGGYGTQQTPPRPPRNVTIADHTPDIRTIYRQTRILLTPSSYESWGRVAIEAAASGIPTIAHPTPGLKEALGDAGIFADRNDHRAWRQHVRDLDDPATYTEASDRARARALELDATARTDLDNLTAAILAAVAAYDPTMPSCPVCGAAHASCGPTTTTTGPIILKAGPKGPTRVFRTYRGQFRWNDHHARINGLLPQLDAKADEPNARTLQHLTAAGVNLTDVATAYAAATTEARTEYLARIWAITPRAVTDDLTQILTAAPDTTPPAPELDPNIPNLARLRVGEVLTWAGTDPARLQTALEAEAASNTARPTLIAKLEALLDEHN